MSKALVVLYESKHLSYGKFSENSYKVIRDTLVYKNERLL